MSETLSITVREHRPLTPVQRAVKRFWEFFSSTTHRRWWPADEAVNPTGVTVNEFTALNYSAVWAAVDVISGDIASLPLILYKRLPNGGKERFSAHGLYELLHDQPNPEMTAITARRVMTAHVLTWGNAYAEIERDEAGRPLALWPLLPDRTRPFRDSDGALKYVTYNLQGTQVVIDAANMFHLPGLGFDGICGYSVICHALGTIGLGLAAERFSGSFFGQGSVFGGILSLPAGEQPLSKEEEKDLRTKIEQYHKGPDKSHRFLILQGGMDYKQLGIPPKDASLLETRKFQVTEVCRWFRLSPHKLADLERATFSNIESLQISHVTETLRPWLVLWEQEILRKLIARAERKQQFAEHLVDAIQRGDINSRYNAYAVGRQWSWLSANDIRERENMNPVPGGDIYIAPVNYADAAVASKPAPAPQPQQPAAQDAQQARELEARIAAAESSVRAAEAAAEVERRERERIQATETSTAEELAAALERERAASAHAAQLGLLAAEITAARDRLGEHVETLRLQLADESAGAGDLQEALDRVAALDGALKASESGRDELRQALLLAQHEATTERQRCTELLTELADRTTAADRAAGELLAEQRRWAEAERLREATIEQERALLEQARKELTSSSDAAVAKLAQEAEERTRLFNEISIKLTQSEQAGQEYRETIARLKTDLGEAAKMEELYKTQILKAEEYRATVARQAKQAEDDRASTASLLAAQTTAKQQQARIMLQAQRALIVHTWGLMMDVEIERILRNQLTAQKFPKWAENFYQQHEERCTKALVPVIRVHLAMIESPDDAEAISRQLVQSYIRRSKDQLSAVLNRDADAQAGSVSALCRRWESERVSELADQIIDHEIAYVASMGAPSKPAAVAPQPAKPAISKRKYLRDPKTGLISEHIDVVVLPDGLVQESRRLYKRDPESGVVIEHVDVPVLQGANGHPPVEADE